MSQPTVIVAGERATVVRDGLIVADGRRHELDLPSNGRRVDVGEGLAAPGLIDLQINGGFGHDFTADPSSIWEVGARLPQFGVTAFLPTIVTSGRDARDAAREAIRMPPVGYRGAMPLGVHFEGPFLSPMMSGAHDPTLLRLPSAADQDVHEWSPHNGVLMVTLAPELPGALELVSALTARGVVVSAGHSTATFEQAVSGFDAGIRYATHLFNAMPPLDKRAPGLVGAALDSAAVCVGLIVDDEHLHPAMVRVAAAAATNERVSLVTDATAALGMQRGPYVLGGRKVVLDGMEVRDEDGRLAGSALSADAALRNFARSTSWHKWSVLGTMTKVPAAVLGLPDRGTLGVGRRADMSLWTADLELIATVIDGEAVHGTWP